MCDILYVHIGAGISEGMEVEIEAATQRDMSVRPFQDIGELNYFLKLDAGYERSEILHKIDFEAGDAEIIISYASSK